MKSSHHKERHQYLIFRTCWCTLPLFVTILKSVSLSVSNPPSPVPVSLSPPPPVDVPHPRIDLPDLIQLVGLVWYQVSSWGALSQNYLVPVPEGVHALRQQLPEEAAGDCSTHFGRRVDLVVHSVEELVPLVRAVPGVLPWLPELCKEQWFAKNVLGILNMGIEPIVQEG